MLSTWQLVSIWVYLLICVNSLRTPCFHRSLHNLSINSYRYPTYIRCNKITTRWRRRATDREVVCTFFLLQFGGFSSDSLAERIADCKAKVIITADGTWRGEKLLLLKKVCDEAIQKAKQKHDHDVEVSIVVNHLSRSTAPKNNSVPEVSTRISLLIARIYNQIIHTFHHVSNSHMIVVVLSLFHGFIHSSISSIFLIVDVVHDLTDSLPSSKDFIFIFNRVIGMTLVIFGGTI